MRRLTAVPAVAPAVALGLALSLFLAATLVTWRQHEGGPRASQQRAGLAAATTRSIDLERWDTAAQWRKGQGFGTRVTDQGRLVLTSPVSRKTYGGRGYDAARWTGPWVSPGFSYTELIASWEASTPGDSWIEVRVRGRSAKGAVTSWDVLARWASGDTYVKRTSLATQDDDATSVDVDTWRTSGLASYQLAVVIQRRTGTTVTPSLDTVTAMTSRVPASAGATSQPGVARGTTLSVPAYSQMVHKGHYPQWGGGGEAWCSPTSVSMVLGAYGKLPPASVRSWVPSGHTDPWVDHAARSTYDYAYRGTGNWAFSTAYGAFLAGKGFVTRLRDLREAEQLVRAGIPPVVSIAFSRGQLTNAPISASAGHLLVIVGFRTNGDVVVNDPAASTRGGVRRVYRRAQFEKVWLDSSKGLTYVLHDAKHPLPPSRGNW